MALIYAADDEKDIRDIINMFIESDGHDIVSFETGDDLFAMFESKPCDLVILDIMMPGTDGLMITNKLRKISKVPIILLTAKDSDSDYIAGLSLGSDDYITKPFKPSLLVAKIRALLRRVEIERSEFNSSEQNTTSEIISTGNLKYHPKEHLIKCNNKPVKLTGTELKFLTYMMKRKDEAISKEEILDEIWGMDAELETRVADETNRRLRKKLTAAGSDIYIQTVWGYGFKLMDKENV